MRLLQRSNTGELSLTKDLRGNTIPPYAILSHTWEKGQEVTFQDILDGMGQSKTGYDKIQFCGQQAEHDGLQYFWVDTCCINKSNRAELQEAINSMFRWYQDAAKCYAYLSDVSTLKRRADNEFFECTWEQAFQESRWFKRGWTLQELLAPSSVEFFSRERTRLGDKQSLKQQLHTITGICNTALEGAPLSQFSDKERFSWIQCRQTEVEEDKSYSLLGIFDVEMPLRYGEGSANAFKRLEEEIDKLNKCLQDLRPTDPRHDKKRIEDTKGGLLEDSYRWILKNSDFLQWRDDEHSRLLWINGEPGKGKTMLLCGIVNELGNPIAKTYILSYFFCQATDSRINSATAVLRGLLFLLVNQQPSLVKHMRKKHDQTGKALFEDTNAWVALSEIFANILDDPALKSTYLIVDALDECVTDLPKLLEFIVQKSCVSSRVKWIVSSRNWPEIKEELDQAGHKVRLCLELNAKSVSSAVAIYIEHKTFQLAQKKRLDSKLRDVVLDYLSLNANNTFLWVALVCQNLEKIPRYDMLAKLKAFPPGLDSLYERMMEQIRNLDDADRCKRILASVAIVYRPITLEELTSLVEMLDMAHDLESLREIIGLCGSFLAIREGAIYFVHQSAKDFLFAKAFDEIFPSGREEAHYIIFSRSLQVMTRTRTLRRDMYDLRKPGYPAEQVQQPDPDPLGAFRYSCIYWVDHLCDGNLNASVDHSVDLQDGGAVDKFVRKKYLYWLEALSLCRSMSKGLVSMARLEALILREANASALAKVVQDAHRFIMYHKAAIENAPLQVYASALLFSPARSLVKALFKEEAPKWITIAPSVTDSWSACLQTLEGHISTPSSVVFSPDSTRLASAAYDEISIWDISSSECVHTLTAHEFINSIAFSPNSAQLASVLNDSTVRLWDLSSWACVHTLQGHSKIITSMVFSHHSAWLASGSDDGTVKLWDTTSGEHLKTLKCHRNWVGSVAFSHDSVRLASASLSEDCTVHVWDVNSGKCLETIEIHTIDTVPSVAFSHDLAQLASVSSIWSCQDTVKIWDASSGKCLRILEGHSFPIRSITFSHDSTRLALASDDCTVKVWDVNSGECLQILEDHSSRVNSVVFSHDSTRLASASEDCTIKVWDASIGECLPTLGGHGNGIDSVAFSPDLTQLASASRDGTIKLWDTSSGKCLQTLNHSNWVTSIIFSYNSTQLASASLDCIIRLWDVRSSKCLKTLKGHSKPAWSVAFSYDSACLASVSEDRTVRIWEASSGVCLQILKSDGDNDEEGDEEGDIKVYTTSSVAFSLDSTRLASSSSNHPYNKQVKVWDTISGKCLQIFNGHSKQVTSVTLSHHSTWLASSSSDGTVKIWDTSSGTCLQTLSIGRRLKRIYFDTSDSYLYTDIGTIAIGALSNPRTHLAGLDTKSPQYQGLGISADGVWITYNSEKVVRLPSKYRSPCSVVLGNTIGFGLRNGRVWICKAQGSA